MRSNRHFQIAVMVVIGLFFVFSQAAYAEDPPWQERLGELELPECIEALESMLELPPAPVPKTGQESCYEYYEAEERWVETENCADTGQDGEFQMGVNAEPRFTDNQKGTVTDNLTGLIWLKYAHCGSENWADALKFANSLYDGWTGDGFGGDCGLEDDSVEGDWRLPNLRELQSLIHYGFIDYALPNTKGTGKWSQGDPFTHVQTYYWSSTTIAYYPDFAWSVYMGSGSIYGDDKGGSWHVWPVRGGN